jgi:hypothetical protein
LGKALFSKLLEVQKRAKRRRDMDAGLAISRELRSWHQLKVRASAMHLAAETRQREAQTATAPSAGREIRIRVTYEGDRDELRKDFVAGVDDDVDEKQ